jgi:hypothetical protein
MRSLRDGLVMALVLAGCVGCSSDGDDSDQAGGAGGNLTPSNAGSGAAGTGGGGTGGGGGAGTQNAGAAGTASGGAAGTASTASGGAAGTTSGGSGGSSATTSTDFCQTALFCDDFESHTVGAVPGAPWVTRVSSGGAVVIDGGQRRSGEKSVKLTTPMGSSSKAAMLRMAASSVFPVAGNAFYGRMLYRLEAAPIASVHWNLITGIGVVPGQTYRAEYRYGGQQPVAGGSQLMANYETPDWYANKSTPGSDCWHHSDGKVMPVAEWACVEWKFESNQMHFWLNGAALEDLTVVERGQGCVNAGADLVWTAPSFTQLDLGWESYQADDARTAYIDDVVIATTRVGCPSPN